MSRVRVIDRALDILDALAAGPMGVTDLAARVGLPKSTVARLLATLGASGAVAQVPTDSRYRLGPRVLGLGALRRAQADLITLAHPHLVQLAAEVGEAAGLSVPEGFVVRYIDQVGTAHEVQVRDWTGTTAPMNAVSSGLVFLADLPGAALERILPSHLDRLTPRTIIEPAVLRERLATVRRDGYAWVHEEYAEGIASAAAAVTDATGAAVAAIHVHGPAYRFPRSGAEVTIGRTVAATAARVSARMR